MSATHPARKSDPPALKTKAKSVLIESRSKIGDSASRIASADSASRIASAAGQRDSKTIIGESSHREVLQQKGQRLEGQVDDYDWTLGVESSVVFYPIVDAQVSTTVIRTEVAEEEQQEENLNASIPVDCQYVECQQQAAIARQLPPRSEVSAEQQSDLRKKGFPKGLANEICGSKTKYPIRFWLVENTEGMQTKDGTRVRFRQGEKSTVVPCTRWEELSRCVEDHARLAGPMGVTTIFRMINGGVEIGVADPYLVGDGGDEVQAAIDLVRQIKPVGLSTQPLAPLLTGVREQVAMIDEQLRAQKQNAVIVLATDRLPVDASQFKKVLKSLKPLHVRVIVRLCSEEKTVVEFYKKLQSDQVEVFATFLNEAKAIYACNPFLNYALPLHLTRETGIVRKFLSVLDERPLDKDELRQLLVMLFGKQVMLAAPDISSDYPAFQAFLKEVNKTQGKHWSSQTMKTEYWIDMRQLNKMYGDQSSWVSRKLSMFSRGKKSKDDGQIEV